LIALLSLPVLSATFSLTPRDQDWACTVAASDTGAELDDSLADSGIVDREHLTRVGSNIRRTNCLFAFALWLFGRFFRFDLFPDFEKRQAFFVQNL
jgi:hypothetical protein